MKDRQDAASNVDLPRAGLLSNGRYSVLLTQEGIGYSAFNGHMLTPWREGQRGAGTHLYVHDLESGATWSSGFEPSRTRPARYEAWLAPGSFHFRRVDEGIEIESEVCVAPDHDAELRLFRIANRGDRVRRLTLTTYAEVAINTQAADAGHPAFSKLFVQTEYAAEVDGLLARRRPRSADEQPPLLLHAFVHEAPDAYETDREAFIGRGRSLQEPRGLEDGLTRTTGAVLDPMLSMQLNVTLDPGEEREIILVSAAGYSREDVVDIIHAMRDDGLRADALLQSTVREQQLRDRLQIGPRNADRYHRLAAGIFRGSPELGPSSTLRPRSRGSERIERKLGLDPSLPLAVGRIADESELATARLLLKARDFWREIGLRIQVLLLNDEAGSEVEDLQEELQRVIAASRDGHEDVVLRHSDRLTPDEQIDVQGVARLWITGDRMDLLRVDRSEPLDEHTPIPLPDVPAPTSGSTVEQVAPQENRAGTGRSADPSADPPAQPARETLQAYNGIGGFSRDGTEYVIRLTPANGRLKLPPAPWVNVIANESAGCIVSETGSGYTWTGNSRENRLTPWYNDPVLDSHGEALYIRDEDSQDVWCPMPGPIDDPTPVEVRHGFGYTRFHKQRSGIEHDTTVFVPRDEPLKIVRMRLTNRGESKRRLTAAAVAVWVLGSSLEERRFVITEYDEDADCLIARNAHNDFLADHIAFAALTVPEADEAAFTASTHSFLGTLADPAYPESLLSGRPLDGSTGALYDPCAAFTRSFELAAGESTDVVWLLGQIDDADRLPDMVARFNTPEAVQEALDSVMEFWREATSTFHVESPSVAIDLMLNGWLVYQNLSCRLWGRSALYQSGGALGFRDQLQDAAALAPILPQLTREQILMHAAHQFEDGDVLHWWHPTTRLGIRSRFSDDLLWLPHVTLHYVDTTGDAAVWDEAVPYVQGPEVPADVDEILMEAAPSAHTESVFDHCRRAIDRSLATGKHGLPLMGSGDWNDGMNRVGRSGKGESIWLAFFLYDILRRFADVCGSRGDGERAATYRRHAEDLREAANEAGWDGTWYRRAYYDNGDPLGSSDSDEACIDALAQAWAAISGAAPQDRTNQALDAVEEHLIDRDAGIVRLLTPPFDKTVNDPGYIRGYVPGVRENGGQYTHAALWVVKAIAEAGRCDRAALLLEMLSPVSHSRTETKAMRYRAEPYVVAADVYGAEPHVGRGGWSWYTGSAGWMLRVGIESIFGIRLVDGEALEVAPCIPSSWQEFRVHYRHPESGSTYRIHVRSGGGRRITSARLDGEVLDVGEGSVRIPLSKDGATHEVEVVLG